MDGDRFDGLTRRLGHTGSRRQLVQMFRTGAIGAVTAMAALDEDAAAAGPAPCEPPPSGTAPAKKTVKCECMRFTWNPVPGATKYIITIDGVERFHGHGKATGGQLTKKICGLPRKNNGTYTDCFQAENDCGVSEPPVCGEFNTLACPS
jgi:hypothetical protein